MDTTTRSRRDLLRLGAGAAAGLAAGAAATLAAPAAALAADGDVIHVGDDLSGTLPTVLSVSTGNGFVVSTGDQAGHAVEGHALNVSGGTGVYGHSDHGFGVEGVSANATGVYGSSPSSIGVWGQSTTGDGVFGGSVDARGVYGASHNGPGLEGWSATGSALKTTGRLEVDRSGIATVAKGASIVKITVPGGITSRALGFASLRRHGRRLHHRGLPGRRRQQAGRAPVQGGDRVDEGVLVRRPVARPRRGVAVPPEPAGRPRSARGPGP